MPIIPTMKLLPILLVVLLVACSGDKGDRVLHYDDMDISEKNVALYMRSLQSQSPAGFVILCRQVKDLNPDEAAQVASMNTNWAETPNIPGATPVPGQKADKNSIRRAMQLLQAECKRT